MRFGNDYPSFSSGSRYQRRVHFKEQSYQVTIYLTWVECGKCRSMSCQRKLVPRRDSNCGPCDRQSGDVSTLPQHQWYQSVSIEKQMCLLHFNFFKFISTQGSFLITLGRKIEHTNLTVNASPTRITVAAVHVLLIQTIPVGTRI